MAPPDYRAPISQFKGQSRNRLLKRIRLRLVPGLVAAAVLTIFTLGVSALKDSSSMTGEETFAAKADDLLRHVYDRTKSDTATPNAPDGQSARAGIDKEINQLSRLIGIKASPDGTAKVDVILNVGDGAEADLKNAGFQLHGKIGDIATTECSVDRLPELASLASVRSMNASVITRPLNDRARQGIGVDNNSGQRVVTQTGRGVVVGIIDTGIDFRHLDFTKPGGNGQQTRIKALLDMTVYGSQAPDPGWNYTLSGQNAPIGRLYTEADINQALQNAKPADQNSDSVKERDKAGHGTHVAGTVAGNGLSSPAPGTYAGMAPEADLVIVKASRQNDGTDDFESSDIINALQFVEQKASELGEPFVINLSLGGQMGPHDGTNPEEQAIDSLLNGGPGRAVSIAAGNDGDREMHASANVPAGAETDLKVDARDRSATGTPVISPGFLDLYYSGSDQLSVTVVRPDGVSIGPVAFNGSNTGDQYVNIYNVAKPQNGQHNISLLFNDNASTLRDIGSTTTATWTIKLHGDSVTSGGHFDAWVGQGQFTGNYIDSGKRISSPGTAAGGITVGAYTTRSNTLILGATTPYSGPGPTADGRQKPDVEAPGHYLYSSKSSDVANPSFGIIGGGPDAPADSIHYTGLAGTSMATAATTGGVALILQATPSLTADQIKYSIINTTERDLYAAPGWDAHAGFGHLSVGAAINLGGKRLYTISGHVTTNGPPGITQVTLSGTRSLTTNTDSNGYYSFTRLPAGGNYTVTPSRFSPYQFTITPSSQTFNNLNSDQTADFTETLVVYSIGGRVADANGNGISGITIVLAFASGSATTDANGYYSFPNLAAGQSYRVQPNFSSKYSFTPDVVDITSLSGNQTVNFTATYRPLYNLSGRITDRNGNGVPNVLLSAYGAANSGGTTTDKDGKYLIFGLTGGQSYTLELYKTAYAFDPASPQAIKLDADTILNFTAIPTHYISGKVTDPSGAVMSGVTLTLSGSRTATRTSFPSTGVYSFDDLPEGGNYTITPYLLGYTANPPSRTFSNTVSNVGNADFVMTRSAPNPIDDSGTFVKQQYRDFLDREPDQAGLDYWTGQITKCGADGGCIKTQRIAVSAAFFIEQEFQDTGYYVYRIYKGSLGRQPGLAEFTLDRNKVVGGATLEASKAAFADAWMQRPEVLQIYPETMSNEDFVNKLYDTAQLAPFTAERQAEITAMANGGTRAQVLRDMIETPDFKSREYNAAFVRMQYFGYLRRDPDAGGEAFWLNVLSNREPNNFLGMVCSFITSTEYQLRFGASITHSNSECQ